VTVASSVVSALCELPESSQQVIASPSCIGPAPTPAPTTPAATTPTQASIPPKSSTSASTPQTPAPTTPRPPTPAQTSPTLAPTVEVYCITDTVEEHCITDETTAEICIIPANIPLANNSLVIDVLVNNDSCLLDSDLQQFQPGCTFDSKDLLQKALEQVAEKLGFMVRIARSDAVIGTITFECTAAGVSEKKRKSIKDSDVNESDIEPKTKERYRNSYRFECPFIVRARPPVSNDRPLHPSNKKTSPTLGKEQQPNYKGPLKITSSFLNHGKGCLPSDSNLKTRRLLRGNVILPQLEEKDRHELEILLRYGSVSIQTVRTFIAKRLPPPLVLDFITLFNLVKKVLRDSVLDDDDVGKSFVGAASASTIESISEEASEMRVETTALQLLFKAGMKESAWEVKNMLVALRAADPTFVYEIRYDNHSVPTAFLWMSGTQRAMLEMFGEVLFFDAKPNGLNSLKWPFFGPCIMDAERTLIAICFAFAHCDDSDITIWILQAMLKFVPSWKAKIQVFVSDAATTKAILNTVLPLSVSLLLCNWHISMEVAKQLSHCVGWALFKEALNDAQYTIESESEFIARFAEFSVTKGHSPHLLQSFKVWYDRRDEWAHYSRITKFTLGVKSNLAEVINAVYAKLTDGKIHFLPELLQTLVTKTQLDVAASEKMYMKRKVLVAAGAGYDINYQNDTRLYKELRTIFSDASVNKLQEQATESGEYAVLTKEQRLEHGIPQSTEHGIVVAVIHRVGTKKFRMLTQKSPHENIFCPCGFIAQNLIACRHICRYFDSDGSLTALTIKKYFGNRWFRRTEVKYALPFFGKCGIEDGRACASHDSDEVDEVQERAEGEGFDDDDSSANHAALENHVVSGVGPHSGTTLLELRKKPSVAPTINAVLGKFKSVLQHYERSWTAHGMELLGVVNVMMNLAEQQLSPASLFESLKPLTGSIASETTASFDNQTLLPRANHATGQPRKVRIPSTPHGGKKRTAPPDAQQGTLTVTAAQQQPKARDIAAASCSFCSLKGHSINNCHTVKGFGTAMTNARWDMVKMLAFLGNPTFCDQYYSLGPSRDEEFPKNVQHLLIEGVLKTDNYGNIAVIVTGINTLGNRIDGLQSQWKNGGLVTQFLAKNKRLDGGRKSTRLVIESNHSKLAAGLSVVPQPIQMLSLTPEVIPDDSEITITSGMKASSCTLPDPDGRFKAVQIKAVTSEFSAIPPFKRLRVASPTPEAP
jgi:hypothetical protein